MSFEVDPTDPVPLSKGDMYVVEGNTSGSAFLENRAAMPTDGKKYFNSIIPRIGDSQMLYNAGYWNWSTEGFAASDGVTVGELHVEYDVELTKPTPSIGSSAYGAVVGAGTFTADNIFGTTGTASSNVASLSNTTSALTFLGSFNGIVAVMGAAATFAALTTHADTTASVTALGALDFTTVGYSRFDRVRAIAGQVLRYETATNTTGVGANLWLIPFPSDVNPF
jgi:hypothetical protein